MKTSLQQLNEAVEQAAGEVRYGGCADATGRPTAQPIYTNNFVALRVTSAADFLSRAAEVMRLWNKANRDADGETKLIFAMEETKVRRARGPAVHARLRHDARRPRGAGNSAGDGKAVWPGRQVAAVGCAGR